MTPAGDMVPGRPYGVRNEAARIVREVKGKPMPEIGGKKLASDFSSMMADVRKSIDSSKQAVADAVKELKSEIESGAKDAAKAIRAEAAEVRKGYGELLGNGPPETTTTTTTAQTPVVPKTP